MFSNRKITCVSTCIVAAVILLLSARSASAQALGSALAGSKSVAAPTAPADPLNRTTPRSSIFAFFQACHDSNFLLAAQYLDLRKIRPDQRASQGPELARQL